MDGTQGADLHFDWRRLPRASVRAICQSCDKTSVPQQSVAPLDAGARREDDMFRGLLAATRAASFLASLVIAPTSSSAQYDLNTCSGRLNYCVEWAKRSGQPTTQCALSYQECERTGVI